MGIPRKKYDKFLKIPQMKIWEVFLGQFKKESLKEVLKIVIFGVTSRGIPTEILRNTFWDTSDWIIWRILVKMFMCSILLITFYVRSEKFTFRNTQTLLALKYFSLSCPKAERKCSFVLLFSNKTDQEHQRKIAGSCHNYTTLIFSKFGKNIRQKTWKRSPENRLEKKVPNLLATMTRLAHWNSTHTR